MFDVGHKSGGASIVLATSNDQKYPPENMIDGCMHLDEVYSPDPLIGHRLKCRYQRHQEIAKINLIPTASKFHRNEETFWTSTGLYPQEFIMGFGHMMDIQGVNLSSYNIRHIQVEKCTTQDPTSFEPVTEKDLPQTDGQLQQEDIDIRTQATYLRFVIDSGYDHFIAVHKLKVSGNALHG